jgi:hypothetical protein
MDKIIKLYENGEFIFDDKILAFNTTTMVRLDSHQSLPIISFGLFEPLKCRQFENYSKYNHIAF